MAKTQRIVWQDKITKELSSLVGERAVNLARLKELDIKTPKFFVVTVDAFQEFFANVQADVDRELEELKEDFPSAKRVASNIKSILNSVQISSEFQEELLQTYKEMSNSETNYEVPTRALELIKSGRDLAPLTLQLSAQQHLINSEKFINVLGMAHLINMIKDVWRRSFSAKALYFLAKNKLSYKDYLPAIIVYKTIAASKSGDLFTVNPLTNNGEQLYIQVIWGMIGNTFDNPSKFIYNKNSRQVEESGVSRQSSYLTKKSQVSDLTQQELPIDLQTKAPLATVELEKLNEISGKIEGFFKFPQHIEWVIGKEVMVTCVEPITNSFRKPLRFRPDELNGKVQGIPLVARDFRGRVIKPSMNSIPSINNEQVLLVGRSDDVLFEAMLNSAGVISNSTSLSSHLAINSREFGVPCVISVKNAPALLADNQEVEVSNGQIFIKELPAPIIQQMPEREMISTRQSPTMQPTMQGFPSAFPERRGLSEQEREGEQEVEETRESLPEREEVTDVVEETINLDRPLRDETVSISDMISRLSDLEKFITNKVYEEAEKRREGLVEISESEQRKVRLLQELEWDIRNLKRKLAELGA